MPIDPDNYTLYGDCDSSNPSEFGGKNIGVTGKPPGQPEPYRAKAATLGGKPPKNQRRVR